MPAIPPAQPTSTRKFQGSLLATCHNDLTTNTPPMLGSRPGSRDGTCPWRLATPAGPCAPRSASPAPVPVALPRVPQRAGRLPGSPAPAHPAPACGAARPNRPNIRLRGQRQGPPGREARGGAPATHGAHGAARRRRPRRPEPRAARARRPRPHVGSRRPLSAKRSAGGMRIPGRSGPSGLGSPVLTSASCCGVPRRRRPQGGPDRAPQPSAPPAASGGSRS